MTTYVFYVAWNKSEQVIYVNCHVIKDIFVCLILYEFILCELSYNIYIMFNWSHIHIHIIIIK